MVVYLQHAPIPEVLSIIQPLFMPTRRRHLHGTLTTRG
jgi:hypothetical protein